MRMNSRTLSAAVFALTLLTLSAACGKKKPPVSSTPPPPTTSSPGRPAEPPPAPVPAPRIANFTAEPRSIERGQSAQTLRWSVANATDNGDRSGPGRAGQWQPPGIPQPDHDYTQRHRSQRMWIRDR